MKFLKPSLVLLCAASAFTLVSMVATVGAGSQRSSRWIYRCKSDQECVERGHKRCSFASAAQHHGVDIGWCKGDHQNPPRHRHRHHPGHGHGYHKHTWTNHYHVLKGAKGRGTTWDYTCTSDEVCQKRGHAWCSFAVGEQRDGVDVGWCQTGMKPGSQTSTTTPFPTLETTTKGTTTTTMTTTATTTTTEKTTTSTIPRTTTTEAIPETIYTTLFPILPTAETTTNEDYQVVNPLES